MVIRCKCCGRRFWRRFQNPDQHYCNRKPCQNERRRRWRRAKLCRDPDYRANQPSCKEITRGTLPDTSDTTLPCPGPSP